MISLSRVAQILYFMGVFSVAFYIGVSICVGAKTWVPTPIIWLFVLSLAPLIDMLTRVVYEPHATSRSSRGSSESFFHFLWKCFNEKLFFAAALILFVCVVFFLILENTTTAEEFSIWAYYALIAGVVVSILTNIFTKRSKSHTS